MRSNLLHQEKIGTEFFSCKLNFEQDAANRYRGGSVEACDLTDLTDYEILIQLQLFPAVGIQKGNATSLIDQDSGDSEVVDVG